MFGPNPTTSFLMCQALIWFAEAREARVGVASVAAAAHPLLSQVEDFSNSDF